MSGQLFGCHLEHPWLGEARVLPPFRRKGLHPELRCSRFCKMFQLLFSTARAPRYHDPTSFVTWPRRVLGSKECGKIQTVRASPFWETRQGARAPISSCLFTVDWGHSSWPTMSGALQHLSPGSLGSGRIGALYNSPVHPGKHLFHSDLKLASVLLVSSGQNVPHSLGPVGSHVEAKSQRASIYILCEYGLGRSGILSCVGPYARGRAHAAQKCGEPHLWLFRSLLLY